ncbi:hypothetical protein Z043_107546 [Scleropages formosus]|uniref:Uncharacterized protein n=1 Tax=Scleropages formosus TaxID=113540 RepID=A0A0P7UGN0_SCLFO|nr:hypothetical protein Z043_107546 [Scleropages formosus]
MTYCRRVSTGREEPDDDSDSEEPNIGLKRPDDAQPQIIHSGHFMVSSPHIEHPPKKGYDFDTVNKQTCQTYHFGKTSTAHFSIDASLTKLFECMTLAYSDYKDWLQQGKANQPVSRTTRPELGRGEPEPVPRALSTRLMGWGGTPLMGL